MKLTNTKTNKSNKGMTLIELTVVILVLLSLISVLFIGARAWMRGSDRANAALLIRNAQQGVRAHCNIMGVDTTDTAQAFPAAWTAAGLEGAPPNALNVEVFGPNKYVETTVALAGTPPAHPEQGATWTGGDDNIPALGTAYIITANSVEAAGFYEPRNLQ